MNPTQDERLREVGVEGGEMAPLRLAQTDEQRRESDVGRRYDGEVE
jgi:hypothetical protein